MSKPQTIDDLSDYEKRPHTFISVDPQFLTTDVNVGAALLGLIAAARASDVFEVSEDGEFKVSVPLTEAEIEGKLKSAQQSWEYNERDYEKACNGEPLESWRRASIDRWAKEEGREPVDWQEYQEFRDSQDRKENA